MKKWIYFSNPFLIVGIKSYKKAVKISKYTDSALAARVADPFYAAQYAIYHPLHLALVAAYNAWKAQGGTQKGATLTVDQLLNLMSSKFADWDPVILGVFHKGTPGYVSLFPLGHSVFYTGQKDERINAVETLGLAMAPTVALAATKLLVDAYFGQLDAARTAQGGQITDTGTDSNDVNTAVVNAMTALYATLGGCINNFPTDPTVSEVIFDLKTVREHEQLIYLHELHAHENESVFEHTFADDDQLELESKTIEPVDFYFAANPVNPTGSTVITVPGNTKITVNRSDFGSPTFTFLHAVNPSAAEGKFRVRIL